MAHNRNTQPIQCHYAVSEEYINTVSRDTNVESPHFPIYLQILDKNFKLQLENDLYLSVSYRDVQTKAQSLENKHQHKKTTIQAQSITPKNLSCYTTHGSQTEYK